MVKNRNTVNVQATAPKEQVTEQQLTAVAPETMEDTNQGTPTEQEQVESKEEVKEETPVEEKVEEVEETQAEDSEDVTSAEEDTTTSATIETPTAEEAAQPEAKESIKSQNETANYVLLELEMYEKIMAPKTPVAPTTGAAQQLKLFRILERVFNRVRAEDFKPCMDVISEWFRKNREGVTSDSHLYRFAAEWTAAADEYNAFTRFVNLMSLTSDPKSRSLVLNDLNFEYYLQYGLTESGRDRLLSYFGK